VNRKAGSVTGVRRSIQWLAVFALWAWPAAHAGPLAGQDAAAGLEGWLGEAVRQLSALARATDADLERTGTQTALRVYLDTFEPIENWYGPGARYGVEPLASAVARVESRFHEVLQARAPEQLRAMTRALLKELGGLRQMALEAGVPMVPPDQAAALPSAGRVSRSSLRSVEMRSIAESFRMARAAFMEGDAAQSLKRVEDTYLQQFEPIEARLPGPVAREIESLIHIRLRPRLAAVAPEAEVLATFDELDAGLARADEALSGESSFYFGAANAFAIIVREGLEAVLLIAAILAYMTGAGAADRDRRRIWIGTFAGVAASCATWGAARTFMPVSGAGREMMEGVTALLSVAVLLYVSNWLFQKTYIHDWKNYLRSQIGRAITTGSAFAMAGLAFAAVYREGFETVLFYQALLFDTSPAAMLAGFAPGLLLITTVGAAIIRLGVRLPLRQLFAATNAVLAFLAFTFAGKGVYSLQEAGVFAPHAISWMPDHQALRQILGVYPLVETTLAQAVLLGLLLGTFVYYRRRLATSVNLAERPVAPVAANAPL